jgi:hypothetical protein
MTNPRDPEGLMPDADVDGPPVTPDGELPLGGAALDGGLDREALRERSDTDAFGGDPDARFPGDAEDPVMTTGEARTGEAGTLSDEDAGTAAGE